MSERETDAIFKAIEDNYKDRWEQTRLICKAFGGEVKLPWDNKTPTLTPEQKQADKQKVLELHKKRMNKTIVIPKAKPQ
jgi:spore maturation protein CgeB